MRQTSRLQLALACFALGAVLIAGIACGGGSSNVIVEPTGTPFYTCRDPYPTYSPAADLPTIENFPVSTVTSQPTVTASGLQIFDEQAGTGDVAQAGGIAYINYTQWVQGGNECERTHAGPVRYRLVKGQVIDGLIEGISGMKVGGKRQLIIPPALGYGSTGAGTVIPPNATLIYDIELTDVSNPSP
jgi:hypothetical protein